MKQLIKTSLILIASLISLGVQAQDVTLTVKKSASGLVFGQNPSAVRDTLFKATGTLTNNYFPRYNSTLKGLQLRSPAQVLADLEAAPLASPTFTGTVTIPSLTVSGDAIFSGLRISTSAIPTGESGIQLTGGNMYLSGGTTGFGVKNNSGVNNLYLSNAGVLTLSSLTNGLVKSTSGVLSNATAGTDYLAPTGSGAGLSNVVNSITGTTSQVTASASTGAVTLSLPQSIATTSAPQFARIGLGIAANATNPLTIQTDAGNTVMRQVANAAHAALRFTYDSDNSTLLGYDGFVNGVYNIGGTILGSTLAGTGTRMVVANNVGELSTQAIPSGGGGGTVATVSVNNANGLSGTSSGGANPALTLTTTINAPVLAGNGTAISAATTTGTGSTVVLSTSPTLVTPALGTPSALVGTNITGTASALSIGGTAAVSTAATTTNDATTNATFYPTFVSASSGNNGITVASSKLLYNPSAGNLVSTLFTGALAGNATTATSATSATSATTTGITNDITTNATFYPTFVSGTSGNLAHNVANSKLFFNPSSGTLVATTFSGALSGNATTVTTNANLTGAVTSVGNATSIADNALSIAKTSGLQATLDLKAPLASPALTGTPTAPTASAGNNSTQIATTAYVDGLLARGTYTPTGTAGSNTTSITPRITHYSKNGTEVVIHGAAQVTTVSTGNAIAYISLPAGLTSAFTVISDAYGPGSSDTNTANSVVTYADHANDRIAIQFYATTETTIEIYFTTQYTIK